jgi:hypothetical protein
MRKKIEDLESRIVRLSPSEKTTQQPDVTYSPDEQVLLAQAIKLAERKRWLDMTSDERRLVAEAEALVERAHRGEGTSRT